MFEGLKEYLLKRSVSKITSSQNTQKRFHNIQTAKSAFVVYEVFSETDYKKINSFIRYLKNQGLEVNSMGYIDENAIPNYCMNSVSADFFCNKEVNFFNKPKNNSLNNFLARNYDILVDFNLYEKQVLKYTSAVCKAQFKISINDDDWDLFDFLLSVKNKQDLNHILKELIHYLENLGKKQ